MNKTDLRKELIALRKETGLTQAEFAKEFGIPKRTIESWEMGVASPRKYNYQYLKEHVDKWLDERRRDKKGHTE